jgi:hypothetical protein
MPSLAELQQAFTEAVLEAPEGAATFVAGDARSAGERLAIYRNTVFANYRKALAATYPVVQRLAGVRPFHAAVDAFVRAHPSTCGDLNVYGAAFAEFLAGDACAASMPYLPDVARLEWAIDEAHRADDATAEDVLGVLAATAPERLPALRLRLEPSCRLLDSAHPVFAVWRAHQTDDLARTHSAYSGRDLLLVRRDAKGVSVERLETGEYAWLAALTAGAPLGAAIDAAQNADPAFDFGAALRAHIAAGTIVGATGV